MLKTYVYFLEFLILSNKKNEKFLSDTINSGTPLKIHESIPRSRDTFNLFTLHKYIRIQ